MGRERASEREQQPYSMFIIILHLISFLAHALPLPALSLSLSCFHSLFVCMWMVFLFPMSLCLYYQAADDNDDDDKTMKIKTILHPNVGIWLLMVGGGIGVCFLFRSTFVLFGNEIFAVAATSFCHSSGKLWFFAPQTMCVCVVLVYNVCIHTLSHAHI